MPPSSPQVDEHGFPIPPTFDDSQNGRRKRTGLGRRFWLIALMLVFMALLGSAVLESGGWDKAKEWMADFLVQRAKKKLILDDLPGALEDLERATRWVPDDPPIYELRGEVKLRLKNIQGSLQDYDKLIELRPRYAQAYMGRSIVYQRLKRHREAIDDLTQAIKLSSEERGDLPRNNRAYARAIAGIELEEAFADIEDAIAADAARRGTRENPDEENAAYLDTRGYLHLLLGRPEQALVDLDQAIKIVETQRDEVFRQLDRFTVNDRVRAYYQRQFAHELAVMYHHRGQAHEKLGHKSEAESDLKKGDSLGYNPDEGVF
jgi:tetratricopeptide (TPR) repeat protein